MSRLRVVAEGDGLVLSGAIDETADLGAVLSAATNGRLVLDLAGVTFINSLGVRSWIRLVASAQRAGVAVELRRVSEPMVQQLNMIIATRGASRVASFYAPYACDACGLEAAQLIDTQAHAQALAKLTPPAMTCPRCGLALAFNDFPERYFLFLSV